MARRRRKRLRWAAGGGLVLCLVLLLGDPFGYFQEGKGPILGTGGDRSEELDVGERGNTDSEGAGDGSVLTTDADRNRQSETRLTSNSGAESDVQLVDDPPVKSGVGTASAAGEVVETPTPVLFDRAMGVFHRYETAIAEDRLVELAVLVEGHRVQPLEVPDPLRGRWSRLQAQASATLDFGDRLRDLLLAGEVLAARRILVPLRREDAPAWLREGLEASANAFGWPEITRERQVERPAEVGDTSLAQGRQVRYREGTSVLEGSVQRCTLNEVTVRISDERGYTFPVIPRFRVEPVDPNLAEAVTQGRVAARAGDDLAVLLWSCSLSERGQPALAEQLRDLLKD